MKDTTITRKQFSAVILTALLSPLMRILPRSAVLLAGKGAWLSVIPALPVLLLLAALMSSLRRQLLPGEGVASLFLRFMGPVFGRVVLIIYTAWFLFYAGFILRSGAERLADTVYQTSSLDPFTLVLLALCLLVSLGTLRAAARTAVLLRAILLGALGLVFIFAIPNLSLKNLFPLTWSDAPGIVKGSWSVFTVGAVAAYFSFLSGYAEPPEKPLKWLTLPLLVFLGVAAILCFEVIGSLGAGLATQLSYPFFTMVRDISLFNIAQRIEAVVIALWVLADFILCTLLLRCANEALRPVFQLPKTEELPLFSLRRGRWLLWAGAAAAYGCNHLLAPSSFQLLFWSNKLLPLVSNCLVFGGFSLLWLVGKLRKMF